MLLTTPCSGNHSLGYFFNQVCSVTLGICASSLNKYLFKRVFFSTRHYLIDRGQCDFIRRLYLVCTWYTITIVVISFLFTISRNNTAWVSARLKGSSIRINCKYGALINITKKIHLSLSYRRNAMEETSGKKRYGRNVMEGKIERKIGRGRPRRCYVK